MSQTKSTKKPYRILVTIGEAAHLSVLLAIAAPLARAREGRVIPLYVGAGAVRPPWLTIPDDMRDVVDDPVMIHSLDTGEAILDYAREARPDLLLVHWRGQTSRGRYLLGRTLDPVIQFAPCDVAVVRPGENGDEFARRMAQVRRVLVPSGGGPNASLAMEIALGLGLASDAEVTALRVANTHMGPTAVSGQWDVLKTFLEPWAADERIRPHVTMSSGVVDGILEEAQQGYDMMMVGATAESLIDRLLFGNLPQELAERAMIPLIIVRRRDATPVATLRRARWRLVNTLPQLTLDERVLIYRQVRTSSRGGTDFYMMMTLAAGIAAFGLLLNSPAVIIGAMIVAPMMSALVGISMGIVQGDVWLLRLAIRTALLGILLVIGVSAVVGFVTPDQRLTQEMLSRGSPTLLDLAVALISGAAAGYATARRDVASALAGVAIAVALVPPLATMSLAAVFLSSEVALGAGLLFLTNLSAIIAAVAIIFMWMGFRPNAGERPRSRTFRGGLLGTALLLLSITLILGALTASSIRGSIMRRSVERAIAEELVTWEGDVVLRQWQMAEREGALRLEITVESTRDIYGHEVVTLQEHITHAVDRPTALSLVVIPVRRVEPVMPEP